MGASLVNSQRLIIMQLHYNRVSSVFHVHRCIKHTSTASRLELGTGTAVLSKDFVLMPEKFFCMEFIIYGLIHTYSSRPQDQMAITASGGY